MFAQCCHDHLRELEQAFDLPAGAVLDELQFIVVADHDPGSPRAFIEVVGRHVRELVGGIKDPLHTALTTFADQPEHRGRGVGAHDHGRRLAHRVIQSKLGGLEHGAAVVPGYLVVLHVSGGKPCRRDDSVQQPQTSTVDAPAFEPGLVRRCVVAGRRQYGARMAEQRKVVGVIAGNASAPLVEVFDQEAQVEDVLFVRKDVVFEVSLVVEDVMEGDRTGANNRHDPCKAKRKEGALSGALMKVFVGYAARRRAVERRGVVGLTAGLLSSLAFSRRVAVLAMVLNDSLKMFNAPFATSPTMSWRLAWTFTRCKPRSASFSGSNPPATSSARLANLSARLADLLNLAFSVLAASRAGAVAASNRAVTLRLTLRAVGVPLRSKPLTCLRAVPIGSDAT